MNRTLFHPLSAVSRMLLRVAIAVLAASAPGASAAQLPAYPAGLSAPPKPLAMPAFDLPTVSGTTFHSESLRGQVVIVRYWASW